MDGEPEHLPFKTFRDDLEFRVDTPYFHRGPTFLVTFIALVFSFITYYFYQGLLAETPNSLHEKIFYVMAIGFVISFTLLSIALVLCSCRSLFGKERLMIDKERLIYETRGLLRKYRKELPLENVRKIKAGGGILLQTGGLAWMMFEGMSPKHTDLLRNEIWSALRSFVSQKNRVSVTQMKLPIGSDWKMTLWGKRMEFEKRGRLLMSPFFAALFGVGFVGGGYVVLSLGFFGTASKRHDRRDFFVIRLDRVTRCGVHAVLYDLLSSCYGIRAVSQDILVYF